MKLSEIISILALDEFPALSRG